MARRSIAMTAIALLAVLLPPAPLAAKPSALLRCDGHGRRDGAATGLARVPALLQTLGLLGASEADDPRARAEGEAGLAACARALRDARVRGDPVRRAEILLMRGIRRLERGRQDRISGDGEAADKAAAGAFDDAAAALAVPVRPADAGMFARSLAVSARLLQAQARLAQGRVAEAEALAAEAVAVRPFAPFLVQEALLVMAASPVVSAEEARLAAQAARLTTRAAPALSLEPATRGRVATMALAWPRWEAPAVATGFGRDLARRPASVTIDRRADGDTRVRLRRPAFIDTQYEAALLLAARLAQAAGADRFAIVDRGAAPMPGRSGLESEFQRLEFVMPGQERWAEAGGRALMVADVEAALGPVFAARRKE